MSTAMIHTSKGDIAVHLFDEKTPLMVLNFAYLATGDKKYYRPNPNGELNGPFYDGSSFHCVMKDYFIQGGCPENNGKGHAGFFFDNEGVSGQDDLTFDEPFRVAMANWGPDKNSSQFIITVRAMPHLYGTNPIFGEVVDPIACKTVLDISNSPTNALARPIPPVVINNIEIIA